MGKKQIQGGKEMNTGVGKEIHIGWERNPYKVGRKHIYGGKEMHTGWEGNTYTVGRKCIHAPHQLIKFTFL